MKDLIKQRLGVAVLHPATNYLLGASILLLVISYMYFANVAVRTLTKLEDIKENSQSLSVEVSEMESKHLAVESGISTEMARSLGLVEVVNTTFIVKNSKQTGLSLKTD